MYGYCGYYYYSLSPNPASSTVTVSAKETTSTGDKSDKKIEEVNIYDQVGNLKKHQKTAKVKSVNINVSSLNPGLYIVEIVDDKYKERQKLTIAR